MSQYTIEDIQYVNDLRLFLAASETRPEEGLEWLRRGIGVGAQMAPPGTRQIIRKLGDAAIQGGEAASRTIREYQRNLERTISEAGFPGGGASQEAPPTGMEWQPTIGHLE